MRALTVKQPWADLILHAGKDVENRSRPVPSTLPHWQRCDTCYAEREPDEPLRDDCGCLRDELTKYPPGEWRPRGPFPFRLGIHAGKQIDRNALAPLAVRPEAAAIVCGWADLLATRPSAREEFHREADRLGALVGFVTVTGCHHADECWKWNPLAPGAHLDPDRRPVAGPGERPGYCSPWAEADAWHWTLADPEPLDEPVPMRGYQGLWRLPAEVTS